MNILSYLFPLLTVLLLLSFFLTLPHLNRCLLPMEAPSPAGGRKATRLLLEDRGRALSRRDLLPILLITLVYACTAFFRLGTLRTPETFVQISPDQPALLTLSEGGVPSELVLYCGVGEGGYDISYSEDGETFSFVSHFDQNYIAVLKWNCIFPESELRPRCIRIRSRNRVWQLYDREDFKL